MRAWQVVRHGEPAEALELVDLPVPEPGPGDVRVAVAAAALGLPDVLMCRNGYPLTPGLPFVPGQEVAGVVTAAGPDAGIPVGTRVMGVTAFVTGVGGFAEETLIPARGAFPVPEGLNDADAAGFSIAYRTGWIGLVQRGRLQPAENLVVLGAAGGTGSAAIQLGHAIGARVIAVAAGPEKLAYCEGLGADVTIDHRSGDVTAAIREATGGRGADVIYDPVGGDVAKAALGAIANEGRLLLIGYASGSWAPVSPLDVTRGNYSVLGVFAGAYDRAFNERMITELGRMVTEGKVQSQVRRTFAFDELPAALEHVAARSSLGKDVLLV
jgi:NADPH2:quinone reductase